MKLSFNADPGPMPLRRPLRRSTALLAGLIWLGGVTDAAASGACAYHGHGEAHAESRSSHLEHPESATGAEADSSHHDHHGAAPSGPAHEVADPAHDSSRFPAIAANHSELHDPAGPAHGPDCDCRFVCVATAISFAPEPSSTVVAGPPNSDEVAAAPPVAGTPVNWALCPFFLPLSNAPPSS